MARYPSRVSWFPTSKAPRNPLDVLLAAATIATAAPYGSIASAGRILLRRTHSTPVLHDRTSACAFASARRCPRQGRTISSNTTLIRSPITEVNNVPGVASVVNPTRLTNSRKNRFVALVAAISLP